MLENVVSLIYSPKCSSLTFCVFTDLHLAVCMFSKIKTDLIHKIIESLKGHSYPTQDSRDVTDLIEYNTVFYITVAVAPHKSKH